MAEGFDVLVGDQSNDRMEMLKAFDETKAGVKGLTDLGLPKIPKIFVRPSEELAEELPHKNTHKIQVPVIDLSGVFQDADRRRQIVEEVRIASETSGFFQVVNHGVPLSVLDGMIEGVREFNEQDVEEKKKYYSRDRTRNVRFNSSYDLFTSRTASWRDSLTISFSGPDETDPQDLPPPCRISAVEYSKHMEILGNTLLGLLSEGLGLKTDHLKNMECSQGHRLHCHYYPACPEPELAIGTTKHSDAGFLTILLQNQITSGLQVLCQGQWIDIHPVLGGLVVNIGDLLQPPCCAQQHKGQDITRATGVLSRAMLSNPTCRELVSNGKFRSNEHRAITSRIGPRISVACFFSGPVNGAKIYGPIEELISKENPAMYKEVVLSEYVQKFFATALEKYRALDDYKV
ncbi:Iron/ascorbate family oxidoreductase [Handroanthus impetiginosus]|uniref:Iron/ascorbate family oxidoreductase n=1 Tax=Handroanthus impetiginosus TaxID=429701 RepID=A0A2G9GKL5_9LAMI|nr:Iron/ascorbate family oxidoreductase [Handroanthus impetiginosus]